MNFQNKPENQNSLFIERDEVKKGKLMIIWLVVISVIIILIGSCTYLVLHSAKFDTRKVDFVAFTESKSTTEFKIHAIERNVKLSDRDTPVSVYVFDVENKGEFGTYQHLHFPGMTEGNTIVSPVNEYVPLQDTTILSKYNCGEGLMTLKKGEKDRVCMVYPQDIQFLLVGDLYEFNHPVYRRVKIDEVQNEKTAPATLKKFDGEAHHKLNVSGVETTIIFEKPRGFKLENKKITVLPVAFKIDGPTQYVVQGYEDIWLEMENGDFFRKFDNVQASDDEYVSERKFDFTFFEGVKTASDLKYYESFNTSDEKIAKMYVVVYDENFKKETYYYEM